MSLEALPVELKLKIGESLELIDFFRLVRTSKTWNKFILKHAPLLPRFYCTNCRIEEFPYKRFRFKASTVAIKEGKMTSYKTYCLLGVDDLKLFLRLTYVEKNLTLALRSSIDIQDELQIACKDVFEVAFRLLENEGLGIPLSIPYLASICRSFPMMCALSVEDFSTTLDENATEIIKTLRDPQFIEFRSSVQQSRLRLDDETLAYLIRVGKPIDVIVLSTHGSCFSKEAIKNFMENMDFSTHNYLELYKVKCTSSAFYNMLQQDMNVNFESEPMRGTYNSFHIIYKGQPVYVNIKFFEDSSGFNSLELPRISNLSLSEQ